MINDGRIYFNEFDPNAAAMLRQFMADGLVPRGIVDERSIVDVQPSDLRGFRQCHFFAGIGLWWYALHLAGRGDDEDTWTGSCPCQPFSAAGLMLGADDPRHLWPWFFRLIAACRPKRVYGEQVASAAVLGSARGNPSANGGPVWLDGIQADLEGAHYAFGATDLPAACVGAPHIRQRLWWYAVDCGVANANGRQCGRIAAGEGRQLNGSQAGRQQGDCEPQLGGAALGLANPDGGQSGHGELQPGGQHGLEPQDGGVGRVVNPEHARLEGHTGNGQDRAEPGRVGADANGPVAEAGSPDWLEHTASDGRCERRPEPGKRSTVGGCWQDFSLILCTDGKIRRIPAESESVFQRMAARNPCDVGDLGDEGVRIAEASKGFPLALKVPHRVPLLRAAGNSINPYVAATFIRACNQLVIPQTP